MARTYLPHRVRSVTSQAASHSASTIATGVGIPPRLPTARVVILRSHPPIGYRAAAVGIDALGAAGDKPGAERGEEGADPADEDQKGIEQANQHAAEQSAAHRGLPRQMPGFQGDEGEGGAEIERDAHRQINRPGR